MADERAWYDTFLGRIVDDGEELELLGGLNFVGFTITPDAANGYYSIANPAAVMAPSATNSLQRNNGAGGLSGTRMIAVDIGAGKFAGLSVPESGAYIALGATPAATGSFRGSNNSVLVAARNAANTQDIAALTVDIGDSVLVGSATQAANVYQDVKTGGFFVLRVNTVFEYQFSAIAADFKDNALIFGSPSATAGTIRWAHGMELDSRNAANSANVQVLRFGQRLSVDNRLTVGDTNTADILLETASAGSFLLRINGASEYTFNATQFDCLGNNIVNVAKLNGCTVVAPVEGAAITTTATINVSQGNVRAVSSASGAYSLTLGTTGSPFVDEVIYLYCLTALANAITVVNGGAGGGNIGFSAGTIPAGFKGMAGAYRYDGTNWSRVAGSVYRTP